MTEDKMIETLDSHLLMTIVTTGNPYLFVENVHFKALIRDIQKFGVVYEPPGRYKISTSVLQKNYEKIERTVDERALAAFNINLTGDFWDSKFNGKLLMVAICTPEPFLVASEYIYGAQTGKKILKVYDRIIQKYGPEKFFLIVNDGGSNMVLAAKLAKIKYPHLVLIECGAHKLNLIVYHLFQITLFANHRSAVSRIIYKFTKNRVIKEKFKELGGVNLKDISESRFSYLYETYTSLKSNKPILIAVAKSNEVKKELPTYLKQLLLSKKFWDTVDIAIQFVTPIWNAIKVLEGDEPGLHLVKNLINTITNVLEECPLPNDVPLFEQSKFEKHCKRQIGKCSHKIHLAAHYLDPVQKGKLLNEEENEDAVNFIMEMGKLQFNSIAEYNELYSLLADYKVGQGLYRPDRVPECIRSSMAPRAYWLHQPNNTLTHIARLITHAPAHSCSVERMNSEAARSEFNPRRANLKRQNFFKELSIRFNSRVLSRDDSALYHAQMDLNESFDLIEEEPLNGLNHFLEDETVEPMDEPTDDSYDEQDIVEDDILHPIENNSDNSDNDDQEDSFLNTTIDFNESFEEARLNTLN